MLFIITNVFMLWVVLIIIIYRVCKECLVPAFLDSTPAIRFKKRISSAISNLFWDIRDECIAHLTTMCEPDGDEPFVPYEGSPLRSTCPPCEYVNSPPQKVEVSSNEYNNNEEELEGLAGARGRGRGRGRARRRQPVVLRLPVPVLPQINENANVREMAPPIISPPPVPVPVPPHVFVARRMVNILEAEAARIRQEHVQQEHQQGGGPLPRNEFARNLARNGDE